MLWRESLLVGIEPLRILGQLVDAHIAHISPIPLGSISSIQKTRWRNSPFGTHLDHVLRLHTCLMAVCKIVFCRKQSVCAYLPSGSCYCSPRHRNRTLPWMSIIIVSVSFPFTISKYVARMLKIDSGQRRCLHRKS